MNDTLKIMYNDLLKLLVKIKNRLMYYFYNLLEKITYKLLFMLRKYNNICENKKQDYNLNILEGK